MKLKSMKKFFLPLMGFAAGIANGLLGAGGGIIIVYALDHALSDRLSDRRDVFANALCVMLPVSAVSCISYAVSGNLSAGGVGVYAIPAILGGAVGGFILGKINLGFLKKLFAALVIYSGVMLIIK
ncbi:MAG: hypothetical protein E7679_06910 [Ruminococcaceae bacterium]|nr:hypothetical protein [Oscillospiraceae bacterium]